MSLYTLHVVPTLPIVRNIITKFRTVAMFILDNYKIMLYMESEGTSMPYVHSEMSDAYLHASLTINIGSKNNTEFAWASRFIQLPN
jgi:hypothetical protein